MIEADATVIAGAMTMVTTLAVGYWGWRKSRKDNVRESAVELSASETKFRLDVMARLDRMTERHDACEESRLDCERRTLGVERALNSLQIRFDKLSGVAAQ